MEPEEDTVVPALRVVAPAYTLFLAGRYALERAQRTKDRAFLELLTANLMTALAFEAFLNHVGQYKWGPASEVWSAVERLSPIAKLKAIAEECDFALDLGARPAQTMIDVCRFRNAVAHGRTEFLEAALPRDVLAAGLPFPNDDGFCAMWEQKCTLDFAQRAVDDLLALTDQLANRVDIQSLSQMVELREESE
jgi:hypothetical protein